VWLRSISTGGNHFTDALAKSFKQQFAKAEQLKKTAATSKYQKQIYQAMRPIFSDLVAEIQRSLGAYNSSHRDSRLDRIICMGNPFKLPNLQKYLQQELKMDVCRLESFKKATVEKAAAFSENILSMSTAFGLAVQALDRAAIQTNLLPVEIARAMMWKKKQSWFIGAAACVAVGSVAMAGQWWKANSDFNNSPSIRALHDENTTMEMANAKLRDEWKKVTDTYEVSRKQVDEQFALVKARNIWPGIVADSFGALPPVPAAQSNLGPLVVITDITPEYSNALAAAEPSARGNAAQTGGPTPGNPAPAAAAAPAATQSTEDAAAVPVTNQGYIISISGYTRTGDHRTASQLLSAIVGKAPMNKAGADKTRDYFFVEMPGTYQEGHLIKSMQAGMGGGYGGAMPSGGSSGSEKSGTGDQPWGTKPADGVYWDMFFEDITGIGPQARTGMGAPVTPTEQDFTLSQPIDLVATRAPKPPKAAWMTGRWAFTLRVKVFIKHDVR
jgi:hypothetical protein